MNFLGKFPESPKNVEFSKSEPFGEKFLKFREESSNGTEIPKGYFPKLSVYPAR